MNRIESARGRAGGILGRKSLAPAGEMKVSIVPGEITTLLSCRLQLEGTARGRANAAKKNFSAKTADNRRPR